MAAQRRGRFDALFDSQNKLDVVGWDGNYGLTVTTASSSPLSWKFAMQHVSSHIGDEYLTRTGRERLNYTREELASAPPGDGRRSGVPMAKSVPPTIEAMPCSSRGACRAASNGSPGLGPCSTLFACYAAADLSSMQERGWRSDVTADFGIVIHSVGRTSRIFIEWHDGRPTANEFFKDTVKTLSLGLRIDL